MTERRLARTAGQGRPKGVPNQVTKDARVHALPYGQMAIEELAIIAGLKKRHGGQPGPRKNKGGVPGERGGDLPARVRLQALEAILDRAYGKPKISVEADILMRSRTNLKNSSPEMTDDLRTLLEFLEVNDTIEKRFQTGLYQISTGRAGRRDGCEVVGLPQPYPQNRACTQVPR